ncbi:hypothetical protein, unlikely [Trypanosoma brucei gambiense DAL972]|uniref:Uncharacterized protein n=1 Tax=Trypanosoma brucei gambiense (strain MHOM/CI/86/DAL972) TaxID=679716 RepID=C9ZML2_TRYB9|nr:hypothetical protein, unlikely [Trypanosoma brucei gambiense DAL972]CBH10515.1 hypothetical protein, unlikely [Trypanosoma brucei gambiense DAL972]|eukprot:XP_011772804.1 hypothetical protein, unlikely [Trypanosoma brucei gambiense DAL972]
MTISFASFRTLFFFCFLFFSFFFTYFLGLFLRYISLFFFSSTTLPYLPKKTHIIFSTLPSFHSRIHLFRHPSCITKWFPFVFYCYCCVIYLFFPLQIPPPRRLICYPSKSSPVIPPPLCITP